MQYFMHYKVKDVMNPDPITVGTDSTFADAEAIFEEHNFDGIPVVDKDQQLIGVVTQYDLLKAVEKLRKKEWLQSIARENCSEAMNRKPETVNPEMPLLEALKKMVNTRCKSMPVIEHDHVKGIIAQKDILTALRKSDLGVIPARLISPELKGLLEPTSLEKGH
ncbi:HPP family protein [Thermodesulfobacteriota bacterium]